MAKILVVGGAGYVGSSISCYLVDQGHDIWVLDDLSTGYRERVQGNGLTVARAGDDKAVSELLESQSFDCVMHFAAKCLVEESVKHPEIYFENNVEQTEKLVNTLLDHGINQFIFSSTCAVFGDPGEQRIHENLAMNPINPYGETKVEAENVLKNAVENRGLNAIVLRYFNVCGADEKLRTGEDHHPETHLIPLIFKAAIEGNSFQIRGTDYPTPDGTCIRDYIHVTDLAVAHEAAMNRILEKGNAGGSFESFNLGSEGGYSVREIFQAIENTLGRAIPVVETGRRPGDPPQLVANSEKARKELGFEIRYPLTRIIETAWAWEQKKRK